MTVRREHTGNEPQDPAPAVSMPAPVVLVVVVTVGFVGCAKRVVLGDRAGVTVAAIVGAVVLGAHADSSVARTSR